MRERGRDFNKRQLSTNKDEVTHSQSLSEQMLESVIPLVQIYLGYTTLQNSYLHTNQFQNPKMSRDRLTKPIYKVGSGVQGA